MEAALQLSLTCCETKSELGGWLQGDERSVARADT